MRALTGIIYNMSLHVCLTAISVCFLMGFAKAGVGAGDTMNRQALSPCPDRPNCVSSMETRGRHYVEPLRYQGSMEAAKKRLLEVLSSFSRTRVLEDSGTYIRATFTTPLLRFTDDVEFLFDDGKKLIHMRSASRTGYSDLGTNRRRCEAVRKRFDR